MQRPSKSRRWTRRLAAAAMAFAMMGFGPDVVDLITRQTDVVEAQYGTARRVSRRTARRTTTRVNARQNYLYSLPGGYNTVVRAGTTYYVAGGTYYRPVHVDGRVAYVVVDDID